jgi:alpha-galactosidase
MMKQCYSFLLARLIAGTVVAVAAAAIAQSTPSHWKFAPAPPLGWNSWDCFGTTLTETQAKAQADAMARELLPRGYHYFTVDIQWYEPNSRGHSYVAGAPLAMDEYSRLVPAPNKFPSATNGAGFKPLADYVHAKGLKFGIHIMRGIPRQAVKQNTALLGTTLRAADIANIRSTCPWNPDMYGVDMSKPGAQDYYDSLFALYASWGVDFVKVDDISRAYDNVQRAEIEAIRKAIDKTGRPIVLSLSPGDTPIERGEHVMNHANLWRISDDFWDRWPPLYEMFGRLEKWTKYRAEGAWPDADMLPFGIVEFTRPTRFTKDEQILCMTLWCIARSPLIFGGDMTKLDAFTRELLTNPEVLAVNQASAGNRQLSRREDLIVWTADVPGSEDKYVALFNAQDNSDPFDLSKSDYRSRRLRGEPKAEVIDIEVPIRGARRLVLAIGDGGNGPHYDHAVWIEPKVSGPTGTLKLTALDWKLATAGWGEARKNRTVDDRPITLNGSELEGIGTHAVSIIEFELPAGYETFTARGMISEGSQGRGALQFLVLVDPEKKEQPERSAVSVAFNDLGFSSKAKVRDLWAKEDIGVFEGTFGRELPLHGSGLYRISPVR